MPLTKLHIITGGITSACYFTLDRKFNDEPASAESIGESFVLGALAGSLPDIIEPPLNRKHRRFFHSLFTLGSATTLFLNINNSKELDKEQKAFLKGLVLAYLTHLALDSTTPRGLPLLF